MKKRHVQHLIIDALEGQLSKDEKRWFFDHLEQCSFCAKEYEDIKKTFDQTQNITHPEPAKEYWDHYWHNLLSKLNEPKPFFLKRRLSQLSLETALKMGLAAAAVVILALGLYFGESFRLSDITDEPVAQIESLQETAQSYLERSKILLTSISNITDESPRVHNFEQQQALSRALIDQTVQLKTELSPAEQKRLLGLISDLEVVLLQIANMDSAHSMNTLEMIQYSLEQKSILFKLNLQEIELLKKKENNE